MRYLCHTRNKILLRAVPLVSPFVEYNYFFLPIQRGNRFQQLRKIDHCHRCNEAWLLQLMCRLIASFNVLVSTYIIAMASTRTANLIDCNFHTIRYLLILRTPRGAPEYTEKHGEKSFLPLCPPCLRGKIFSILQFAHSSSVELSNYLIVTFFLSSISVPFVPPW